MIYAFFPIFAGAAAFLFFYMLFSFASSGFGYVIAMVLGIGESDYESNDFN